MRPFVPKCNDLDALTFDASVMINFGVGAVSHIDASYFYHDSKWKILTKNEHDKTIEIWSTTGAFSGTYTLDKTITFSQNVEGPSLAKEYYYVGDNGSRAVATRYHLFVDFLAVDPVTKYNFGSGLYLKQTSDDLETWGNEQVINTTAAVRHDNVINLSDADDPQLAMKAATMSVAAQGDNLGANYRSSRLPAGTTTLAQQDDTLYWVGGTDVAVLGSGPIRAVFDRYESKGASGGSEFLIQPPCW